MHTHTNMCPQMYASSMHKPHMCTLVYTHTHTHTHTHQYTLLHTQMYNDVLSLSLIPACSPSRGGDVVVYIKDINQPSLPTPLYSVLVSISVFMAFPTIFHSINSCNNSAFALCSSCFNSALLVLSTIDPFMKVFYPSALI